MSQLFRSVPGLVLLVIVAVLLYFGLNWAKGVGQGLADKLQVPAATAQER